MEKNRKSPRKERLCQFCSNHGVTELRTGHKYCLYRSPLHTEFCPACDLNIQRRKNDVEFKLHRKKEGLKDDGLVIDVSGNTNRCCNLCKNHSESVPVKGHQKHCKYNTDEHRKCCKLCENRQKHRQITKKQRMASRNVAAAKEPRSANPLDHAGKFEAKHLKAYLDIFPVSQILELANSEVEQLHYSSCIQHARLRNVNSAAHATGWLPYVQPVNLAATDTSREFRLQEIIKSRQPLLGASAAGPSPELPTGAAFIVPPPCYLPQNSRQPVFAAMANSLTPPNFDRP